MTELKDKSIHDLRVMAQAFGISDIFEKDSNKLIQEIELKQQDIFKPPKIELPFRPEYDARFMTALPSERSSELEIVDILEPYIRLGLKLRFDNECWYMDCGTRQDSGTIHMPLRHILIAAEKVLR